MNHFVSFSLLLLVAMLAACDNSSAMREVGIIEPNIALDEEVLSAPETVQAGVPFDITVRTIGGGCTEADGVEREVSERLAVLKPFDLTTVPGNNSACPAIVTRPEHTAQITFEEAGSATIRVEGRSEDNTVTGGSGGEAVIEQTITVE